MVNSEKLCIVTEAEDSHIMYAYIMYEACMPISCMPPLALHAFQPRNVDSFSIHNDNIDSDGALVKLSKSNEK